MSKQYIDFTVQDIRLSGVTVEGVEVAEPLVDDKVWKLTLMYIERLKKLVFNKKLNIPPDSRYGGDSLGRQMAKLYGCRLVKVEIDCQT